MGPLVVNINIIANFRCTHVLLQSKSANRNWIDRLCVIIFIISSFSIGGGGGGRGPSPSGYAYGLMITAQVCPHIN